MAADPTLEDLAAWFAAHRGRLPAEPYRCGELLLERPARFHEALADRLRRLAEGDGRIDPAALAADLAAVRAAAFGPDGAAADLELQCVRAGLPRPALEHRFAPPRRWRFDYCWPDHRLALEVEGGVWTRGRHTRGAGFLRDLEKYNAATLRGWRLIRVPPKQVADGTALELVRQALRPGPAG